MPSVHSNEQRSDKKKTVVYSRSEHSVNSACLPYQKAVLRAGNLLGPQVVTSADVIYHTFAVPEPRRSGS